MRISKDFRFFVRQRCKHCKATTYGYSVVNKWGATVQRELPDLTRLLSFFQKELQEHFDQQIHDEGVKKRILADQPTKEEAA